jgi:signal transduction histidine kinase
VILACVLLPRFMAFVHTFLGYLMFAALVLTEWFGWIPPHYPAGAVANPTALDGRYLLTVLVVQGMLMALTVILLTSLTQLLRRGEAELRQANDEVTHYSDLLRNFLRIVIHDVKSPVAAAVMSLYRLELGDGGVLSEKQREIVGGIQRRLGNLTDLLRDFQVLAAFDSADLDKHGEEVDMVPLLHNVVRENQDIASARRHSLLADVPSSLPVVHGIPRLLEECITNLVTNAVKYTPEGGKIVVRAFARDSILRIEVEDNGIGIAPADQVRLFQDFVRIRREDVPTSGAEGSGLGLSIVRRIAEMHKGSCGVIGERNRGSVFYIELPVAPRRSAPASVPHSC